MIEDKAWFIKGLRNLSDNVKSIRYHRSNSLFAIRAAREAGVKLNSMHGLPEVVAWHKFKAELCEELNAAVSVGNDDYEIELASCRKLAIAMESGIYLDEHSIDAIAELSAAADRLEREPKAPLDTRIDEVFKKVSLSPLELSFLQTLVEVGEGTKVTFDDLGKVWEEAPTNDAIKSCADGINKKLEAKKCSIRLENRRKSYVYVFKEK